MREAVWQIEAPMYTHTYIYIYLSYEIQPIGQAGVVGCVGGVVANLVPASRVNPEPGGREQKSTSVQKVVNMYVVGVLVMRVMQMTLNGASRSAHKTI